MYIVIFYATRQKKYIGKNPMLVSHLIGYHMTVRRNRRWREGTVGRWWLKERKSDVLPFPVGIGNILKFDVYFSHYDL
jgi:hypothetical protein